MLGDIEYLPLFVQRTILGPLTDTVGWEEKENPNSAQFLNIQAQITSLTFEADKQKPSSI